MEKIRLYVKRQEHFLSNPRSFSSAQILLLSAPLAIEAFQAYFTRGNRLSTRAYEDFAIMLDIYVRGNQSESVHTGEATAALSSHAV